MNKKILLLMALIIASTATFAYDITVKTYEPNGTAVRSIWTTIEGKDNAGNRIYFANQYTNDAGTTTFKNAPQGTYTYTAYRFDKVNTTGTFDLIADTTIAITMSRLNHRVILDFFDYNVGKRLMPEITFNGIKMLDENSGISRLIVYMPNGEYDWSAKLTGYYPVSGSVTVAGDHLPPIVNWMTREPQMYWLTAGVFDQTGKRVVGANITIGGITKPTGWWGEQYFYLKEGTYTVTAEKYGATVTKQVTIAKDGYLQLDLPITVPRVILFNIVDKLLNPIKNVLIKFAQQTKLTDENGQAQFEVQPGSYNYIIEKNGYEKISGSIAVQDDMTINKTLTKTQDAQDDYDDADEDSEGYPQEDFKSNIIIPDKLIAGQPATILVTVRNQGSSIKNAKITATIPELGVMASVGPYELSKNEQRSAILYLDIPTNARGEYWLRISYGEGRNSQTKYRPVIIG